ncbi:stage II sporulation protein P [Proteinivorax tanatarense]|uniref:Stage II sporulation protein P n=1 Tax=Proteinivorax tanatarense TaxID=1260629 RepID=A0AAU7VIA4_9FIRM
MKKTKRQNLHSFKNSNRLSYRKPKKSSFEEVNLLMLIITVLTTFLLLSFVMKNYYTQYPHLFKDHLLQTVPAFEMVAPREEDIVEHSLIVNAISVVTGINVTAPFSLVESQVPVFAQIEYASVISADEANNQVDKDEEEEEEKKQVSTIKPEDLKIAIYHSHTTEAFVPTSGIPHTEDFDETIVKVGEHLKEQLESMGMYVYHDKTYHNQRHSESYRKSARTVEEIIEKDDFDLIIDLHRDGVGQSSSVGRPVTTEKINGEDMGKLLFLVGGRHDNWRKNYALANALNEATKQKYPGLSRGVIVRSTGNYNQDLHNNILLIEIGGHWNTLDEAIKTTEPLSKIILEGLQRVNE